MAFITFLLLPRMSDSTLYRDVTGQRVIGFTNSVRLGELGTAVENREPVLRLWFYPPESDEPFRLRGQPLLRGSIVNYYQNGTWSIAGGQLWNGVIELPIAAQNATRQRIAMPPQREQTIFAVFSSGRLRFLTRRSHSTCGANNSCARFLQRFRSISSSQRRESSTDINWL